MKYTQFWHGEIVQTWMTDKRLRCKTNETTFWGVIGKSVFFQCEVHTYPVGSYKGFVVHPPVIIWLIDLWVLMFPMSKKNWNDNVSRIRNDNVPYFSQYFGCFWTKHHMSLLGPMCYGGTLTLFRGRPGRRWSGQLPTNQLPRESNPGPPNQQTRKNPLSHRLPWQYFGRTASAIRYILTRY